MSSSFGSCVASAPTTSTTAKGFNRGQLAEVIEVEAVEDFDAILDHIARTDFYGTLYMERQSGHIDDRLAAV